MAKNPARCRSAHDKDWTGFSRAKGANRRLRGRRPGEARPYPSPPYRHYDGVNRHMKIWSDDHPKAKAMARKSTAIQEAARTTFLRLGYEGTCMESIAAAAGVSVRTL